MIDVPVLDGGTIAFDAILYPQQFMQSMNTHQHRLNEFMSRVGQAGQHLAQRAMEMYNRFFNDNTLQIARQAQQYAGMHLGIPTIVYVQSVHDLQNANPYMQRWIMADPLVRENHLDGNISGYVNTYIDIDPDALDPKDHHDYQLVMDGVVQWPTEDTDKNRWCIEFFSSSDEDDTHLSTDDKADILHAWSGAEMAINAGIDPTDIDTDNI